MSDANVGTCANLCPLCGSKSGLDPEYMFEQVCANCGFVLDGNDPKLFFQSQRPASESNLATESWLEFASVRNATEDRLVTAIDTIEQLGLLLGLGTQSRIRGAEIFGRLFVNGDTHGRRTEELATAALYWAVRTADQPVPMTVFARFGEIENSSLRHSIDTVRSVLDIPIPPTTPTDYVGYLSHRLELTDSEANDLNQRLQSFEAVCEWTGRNPIGVAAAAVYRLLDGDKTQAEICEAAGISTETIRVRIAELAEARVNDE
ncbi:transcription initiation factor IIB family protein [Halobaculum litoreum]|uniref:transcription initiation factor IIB family protein n=1 Tax=Halobaculum litoreum TaxID=3031998 RepID=UPI0024C36229|nr:transcription initiation factor IIB family protein [Halobaculum sp. DT92]